MQVVQFTGRDALQAGDSNIWSLGISTGVLTATRVNCSLNEQLTDPPANREFIRVLLRDTPALGGRD